MKTTAISAVLMMSPTIAMRQFLMECHEFPSIDLKLLYQVATTTIRYLQGSAEERARMSLNQEMEGRWYASLAIGTPDWSIYDSDLYLAELWACWIVYSRRYLSTLHLPRSMPPKGIVRDLGRVRLAVDLGCGIGYSTAAMTEMFTGAEVIGTNLDGTKQTAFAKKKALKHGFRVVPELSMIQSPVDLVLASEYFEHFQKPIDHLIEVVEQLQPRTMLIANSFTQRSIGHFPEYECAGEMLEGKVMSDRFNTKMQELGFTKMKTGMWNNRPSYWKQS